MPGKEEEQLRDTLDYGVRDKYNLIVTFNFFHLFKIILSWNMHAVSMYDKKINVS